MAKGRSVDRVKIGMFHHNEPLFVASQGGAGGVLSRDSIYAVIMKLDGIGERYGFDDMIVDKRLLDIYGFNVFTYFPFDRRLIPHEGISSQSVTTRYIRNIDSVEQPLVPAPPFTVKRLSI